MDLQELVDELRKGILRDTSDLDVDPDTVDGAAALEATYLWSTPQLVKYINLGYYRLAEKALLLRDKTTDEVCNITLVAGQGDYELHEAVLSVMSARIGRRTLQRLSHSSLTLANPDVARRGAYTLEDQEDAPVYFTTDEENGTLRLYPTPDEEYADEVLNLRVCRLPLEPLEFPDNDADPAPSPEIHSQYHYDILEWAAYLALRNHDTDGENLIKARSHKNAFNDRVKEAQSRMRKSNFQPPQFAVNARW